MFGTFPSRAKTDNLATVSWFPEEKMLSVKSFNNDVFFSPPLLSILHMDLTESVST